METEILFYYLIGPTGLETGVAAGRGVVSYVEDTPSLDTTEVAALMAAERVFFEPFKRKKNIPFNIVMTL